MREAEDENIYEKVTNVVLFFALHLKQEFNESSDSLEYLQPALWIQKHKIQFEPCM